MSFDFCFLDKMLDSESYAGANLEMLDFVDKSQLIQKLQAKDFSLNQYMKSVEEQFIFQALSITQGNKNQAAQLLGINRTTLIEKIKKI